MANGFGALWVGTSGLKTAHNALNVTANNMTNVNTEGYVRQQVMQSDETYRWIGSAAISAQYQGLGVGIGDIIHNRDIFLDKAYRSEVGRYEFYNTTYEAEQEVETFLQESNGQAFQGAIKDLYEAFAEFAKDPSDTVNQDLVLQKSSLFLSRSNAVLDGVNDYQTILNTKVTKNVNRINEIGEEIKKLNLDIQRIEAAGVETAMDLRDARDLLVDELSGYGRVRYTERPDGVVKINFEDATFVDEVNVFRMATHKDKVTGFETPYWPYMSDEKNEDYCEVFDITNTDATKNTDIGELKALLLARGDRVADYRDMVGMDSFEYEHSTVGNSIMMNTQTELDSMIHKLVTDVNNFLSPIGTLEDVYGVHDAEPKINISSLIGKEYPANEVNDGSTPRMITITEANIGDIRVADVFNCAVGSDGTIPPRELFTRIGCERYTAISAEDTEGNPITVYIYNEEPTDYNRLNRDLCYSLRSLEINEDIVQEESYIAHRNQDGSIAYEMGAQLEQLWDDNSSFKLNPSDETPCSVREFYTKWVGELANVGSVYKTTSESLKLTSDSIDNSRQQVIGVSTDEELTNMIKYQQAYNAASRYINVVNEMTQHLISNLGH